MELKALGSAEVPLPVADAANRIQRSDLKGPVYLEGDSTKYYVAVLRDRYSHRCTIEVLDNREAQNTVDFLVASWRWLGLPDYLQMDNALALHGSNRYPRSFGKVIRAAIDLLGESVFNPPYEPLRTWRQSHKKICQHDFGPSLHNRMTIPSQTIYPR